MKKKRFISYSLLLILLLAFAVATITYAGIREGYLDEKLLVAVRDQRAWQARLLVKAGTDVNARDDYGRTPLMEVAVSSEHYRYPNSISIFQFLLENGADINARDNDGCTPLMYAIFPPAPDVVETLLQAGADVNAKDNAGKTALIYVMLGYCGYPDDELVDYLARILVSHGADVNVMTKDGCRALDFLPNDELAKFLMDAGAIAGEGCQGFICT